MQIPKPKDLTKNLSKIEKLEKVPRPEHPFINLNPRIPPLKRIEDKTKLNIRYVLISPYVSCHIYWNQELKEVVYEVEEPILTEQEKKILEELKEGMTQMINLSTAEKSQEAILSYIDKIAKIVLSELGYSLSRESYERIYYYLYRDFVGLNEIEPLMQDFFIEDIECNGVNSNIYVVHRLYRNLRTNIIFEDMEKLASFVEKLAQRCGRYISYANPILDGTLPDGSRVNATYTTDVTSKGPTFTVRKFTKIPLTPIQLLALRTLSPEMLSYLWILVQYKCNILIVGATGSGKTTLLNVISFFIPPEARIVSIEDTREINLLHENWLPSVARAGIGGIGEVDLFTLLRESFRQNPDYVIVGEVRGKEAYVLFQGMASGHPSLSTMHADSVDTVIKRLQTPPISLSPTLINTLDTVVVMQHAKVKNQDTRRVREIVEIVEVAPEGKAVTEVPFFWDSSKDTFLFKKKSKVLEKISIRYGIPIEELYQELEERTRLLISLWKNKVFSFEKVQKIINEYYKHGKITEVEK
ncbi:MAG: type II/IV secretion system ATPase subunit [Candidatus Pacearchaeota archaeon]|nr:type II/IV secretion system ATPase subunit [Candidatus Pacearchaeota archaeon]